MSRHKLQQLKLEAITYVIYDVGEGHPAGRLVDNELIGHDKRVSSFSLA